MVLRTLTSCSTRSCRTKDLGGVPEKELIARGLVRDVLSTEYDARVKLHPKTPPVP
jgi:hypothetical protein